MLMAAIYFHSCCLFSVALALAIREVERKGKERKKKEKKNLAVSLSSPLTVSDFKQ